MATGAGTLVLVGQGGKQAFDEIYRITSRYRKINHITYEVNEDILTLDLEDEKAETMKLTIDGVRNNREVKNMIKISFKGLIDMESESWD